MTFPKLRYYQTDVVERAASRVKAGLRRGIIQGGTGAGKGHCLGYLAWRAKQKGSRVLLVADRRRLVNQLGGVLNDFGVPYGVIMAGQTGGTREPVILACRDTFKGWLSGGRELPPFDLLLPDEGHLFPSSVFQQISEAFPRAVTIAATATPCRNDGKSMGDYFEFLECMVPASQLIREGYLIKPEVYAPVELATKRKKGAGRGLAGDPVGHWLRHAKDLPTIAFAAKVTESLALRNRFIDAGVSAEHIDADCTDAEREAKFKRLQTGETKVLCSVRLLIQGVDIPEVACAIFWAKFGSLIDWYQGNGRIMRPAPGKSRAVCLDHAGAAGEHGLPGEDVAWSLDMGSTVGQRRQKAIDADPDLATVICKSCGYAFNRSPTCPSCGKPVGKPQRKQTMSQEYEGAQDAILERFDGEDARTMLHEQRQRQWWKAIRIAIAKGGTAGMAAGMFKSACKVFPWEANVSPLPADRGGWKAAAREAFPTFSPRTPA